MKWNADKLGRLHITVQNGLETNSRLAKRIFELQTAERHIVRLIDLDKESEARRTDGPWSPYAKHRGLHFEQIAGVGSRHQAETKLDEVRKELALVRAEHEATSCAVSASARLRDRCLAFLRERGIVPALPDVVPEVLQRGGHVVSVVKAS